jgi:hypothetical protein
MNMARVVILAERTTAERRWKYGLNAFELYAGEILAHAGIPFEWVERMEEAEKRSPDFLIVALMEEDDATLSRLSGYAERGGHVISYGGLNRMAGKLGCASRHVTAPGYARISTGPGESEALRYLQAKLWLPKNDGDGAKAPAVFGSLHRDGPDGETIAPALLRFQIGRGWIDRWNVDIPGTIVGIQQGTLPVVEDGIPAEDGSGALDEGILKADDKCELDWSLDRVRTETGAPYYAKPYADLWREAMLGHLLRSAVERGLTLPFLGYWPEGVRQVALISHDSDHNLDESAEKTLDVLHECGIRSTWCMLEPGYSKPLYERISSAGHELAFHYNALPADNGFWDEAEFARQLRFIREATGERQMITNKNHYTRYEGWGELFRWCEANGIEADQTRGPSKRGNIGFLFGTCHPYFPMAWSDEQNRLYDVLEIGFLTQDLDHHTLADSSVIAPFLEGAARVEGVAHFLFHQVHILKQPKVADALRKVVAEAKGRGFDFWTCREINAWERKRRKVRIRGIGEDGAAMIDGALAGAVVWIPLPDDAETDGAAERRFGVRCRKQIL